MAIVRKLKRVDLERESKHTEVDCTYSIVEVGGRRYLQIDTYSSAKRKIPGKKSQSIRFSPEALKQLLTILTEQIRF